jgi:hypothetical protein
MVNQRISPDMKKCVLDLWDQGWTLLKTSAIHFESLMQVFIAGMLSMKSMGLAKAFCEVGYQSLMGGNTGVKGMQIRPNSKCISEKRYNRSS